MTFVRSRTEKYLVIAILVAVGLCTVVCAIGGFHTQTDSVTVTAIDDGYDIRLLSEGRYLMPLTPEGPFPKWSHGIRLFAEGSGEKIEMDGLLYKKYRIGKDLTAVNYSSGIVCISEEGKRLVTQEIDGGKEFDNITIEHPQIVSLNQDSKIEDLDHCYIRARGRFEGWKFKAAGKIFETNWTVDDPRECEVIGFVVVEAGPGRLPNFSLISRKPASEK
jgi:hypothetical protein